MFCDLFTNVLFYRIKVTVELICSLKIKYLKIKIKFELKRIKIVIYPVDIITQNLLFSEKHFQFIFEYRNRHCSIWYIQHLPSHVPHYTCSILERITWLGCVDVKTS